MGALNKRILIILDSKSRLKGHLKDLIETKGLHCEVCTSSRTGINRLHENKFFLTIIDYDTPKMDSLDLLNALGKKDYLSPPLVILFLNSPNKATRKKALRAGAYAVLEKPLKTQELLSVIIRAYKRYAHTLNHKVSPAQNPLICEMTSPCRG